MARRPVVRDQVLPLVRFPVRLQLHAATCSLEYIGKAVAPALLRRMAALLIIGVLLFQGDILTLYASAA
ncbi:hypothetical protein [Verrucomicrobium spinosum]|uniref:hypothetical protein n=1 Tax=Verrucomicrobium spinosum TaxID=2736 RepID=UPI0012E1E713|nr:hypothetical protein [Verrucomicrobium spinosum]